MKKLFVLLIFAALLVIGAFASDFVYVYDDDSTSDDYDEYEYYSESDNSNDFGWQNIVLPLVIGVVVGGISVLCVKGAYKIKVHGATYPLSQYSKLNLIASKDDFVNKTVVVTHIPDPPSNSGGKGARTGGR